MAKTSKSSEHGLGGFIDDRNETSLPLHLRIWEAILEDLLSRGGDGYANLEFAARKRVPLNRPALLKAFCEFNRGKPYCHQIKPFGFLQTVIAATQNGSQPRCIAPFERDAAKSRKLPWMDLHSGEPVSLDWFGTYAAHTIPVQRLDEFARRYRLHPEEKGADAAGNPAGSNYTGILGRLHIHSTAPTYIGKEIDRLSEDEDMNLEDGQPVRYESGDSDPELKAALEVLKQLSQAEVAQEIGISERRLRDIERGRVKKPHKDTRDAILWLGDEIRAGRRATSQRVTKKSHKSPRNDAENKGGGSGSSIAIALFFLVIFVIATVTNKNPQPYIWPLEPDEE
jgi:Helix-turn-helix